MSSKLIQPPSMAASGGVIPRKAGNAKVLVSFSSFNGKTLSFSDKPFRLRSMFMRKVTEQSSASSPNEQQEEEYTVSQIKEELHEALEESQKSNVMDNVDRYTHGEVVAMVGLDAMKNAKSTLEDFFRSYFMFHELEVTEPQSIFRYLPVLSFTESYVYQMDALNEKIVSESACGSRVIVRDNILRSAFETVPLKPLEDLLEREGLLTQRIQQEFRSGEEYWALERKLCFALSNKNKICLEDVMRAIHFKSFDYRVLNLLLYKLRGEEVNELHMDLLSISTFLFEVADDLLDYEDDVLNNSFNILRMFVGIFGSTNAPTELAKMISEAEEKYKETMKSLDPHLSSKYQRRCEEAATKEGGENAGRPLGTWNIPEVISDEEAYRAAAAAQR